MKIKPENRFWIWIYGFTAFIMLLAMSVFGWLAWTSREEPGIGRVAGNPHLANSAVSTLPEESYELLAAFDAPVYVPERGAPQAFRAAMELYTRKSYKDAATALRPVTESKPDLVAARFYLGVSLLLAGDRISGIQELRDITDSGEGPYLERARFYLAKGLIAEHDIRRAKQQLQDLIAQHGDLEKQATVLLGQIQPS